MALTQEAIASEAEAGWKRPQACPRAASVISENALTCEYSLTSVQDPRRDKDQQLRLGIGVHGIAE